MSLAAAQSAERVLDLSEFLDELDRLARDVSASDPAAAASLAARLPGRWIVRTRVGSFEVPAGPIAGALLGAGRDGWPARRDELRRRLLAARAEAAALDSLVDRRQTAARPVLEEILARPEFRRTWRAEWMARLRERIDEWFRGLWNRLGGRPVTSRQVAVALAWIAALGALVALAGWIVRMLLRARPGPALQLGPGAVRLMPSREWAERALAAARAGDVREAVRCAYNAAVRRFEEDGLWRPDAARTPREYLRLVPAGHARRAALADLTRRFEQVWYGHQDVGADVARDLPARLQELGCLGLSERAS
jgi:hypothetical protein